MPVDLPAVLILGVAAAGIARKVVSPWPGWTREPTNLFVLCALPTGERKSQMFAAVFARVTASRPTCENEKRRPCGRRRASSG